MRKSFVILAAVALAACSRTETQSGGEVVDTTVDNSKVNIDLGITIDTVSMPTFGMETDTIIVKKPVIGRKPVEMKRPTVDVTKKP